MSVNPEDLIDEIELVIDHIDNLSHALKLKVADHIHLNAIRTALPRIRDELVAIIAKMEMD